MENISVYKDEKNERHIPSIWRGVFENIVHSFVEGDFSLERCISNVDPLKDSEARFIESSISAYGDPLIDLPKDAWQTSVYRWQRGYWEVLVDLFTEDEGASDLVLFARVFETEGDKGQYRFIVDSVHVP